MTTERARGRMVLPFVAVLSLGIAGCEGGAGVAEEDFTELEDRVTTLEEDFGGLEEEFNTFTEDGGLAENGALEEEGAVEEEEVEPAS